LTTSGPSGGSDPCKKFDSGHAEGQSEVAATAA
jgi:hypothetical protein